MKVINVKKIGDDFGGDNLSVKIYIDKESVCLTDIDDRLYKINKSHVCDFEWDYFFSYDNMDYNGLFFVTTYIDKDNLYNSEKEMIEDIILMDCEELLKYINDSFFQQRFERQRR